MSQGMSPTEGEVSIASSQSTNHTEHNQMILNPYNNNSNPIPTIIRTANLPTTRKNNYYTKTDLRNWLTQARQTRAPDTMTLTAPTNDTDTHDPTQTNLITPTRVTYQPAIQKHRDNPHWGDKPPPNHPKTFTVVSRNANTISTKDNLLQWRATAQALQEIHANIACIQEPNVNWNPNLAMQIQRIFQQQVGKAKIATSSSFQATVSDYQPGGTATISLGSSTSRTITTYDDPFGLSRWSAIALRGKSNKTLLFVTAYRVCNQSVTLGSQKAYTQQYTQLIQAGHVNPDPREIFVTDLTTQIKQWQQQQYEILLCMDTNENLARLSPTQGIGHLLHDTGLVDLHQHRQPCRPMPPTYNHGTTTIDVCIGSTIFVQALTAAWYLPFGHPVMLPRDHRLLGMAFDTDILFGYKLPDPQQPQQRGAHSNTKTTVKRFSKLVVEGFLRHDLFDQIYALAAKSQFAQANHQ